MLTGDLTITARVVSETNTDVWAKAGVMIRATTADNSAFAGVFATPGNGVAMIIRTATGAGAVDLGKRPAAAPVWVRLRRSANTFTGYMSADGVSWTLIATRDIGMTAGVSTGLAVTSKREFNLNTSVFDTGIDPVTRLSGGQNFEIHFHHSGSFALVLTRPGRTGRVWTGEYHHLAIRSTTYGSQSQRDASHSGERRLSRQLRTPVTQPLDGQSYGQPLYASAVSLGTFADGFKPQRRLCRTEHCSVYAFDGR